MSPSKPAALEGRLVETEAELQAAVIDLARLYGWRVAHFRASRTKRGWSTAVAADGKGYPDLTLVRPPELLFVELKGEQGRVSPEQLVWLEQLDQVGQAVADVALVAFHDDGRDGELRLGGRDVERPAVEVLIWKPSEWPEIAARLRPRVPGRSSS